MTPQTLGLEAQPGSPDTLSATNSPQDPQTITPPQLQQLMDPQNITQLQSEMSGWQQNQQLPDFNPAISAILNTILNAANVGPGALKVDVQAKTIQELSAAAHLLAQAAQQLGEHIPASINVRLQGAQLDMQMRQQAHDMALNHYQTVSSQQLAQQQQQHQQAMDLAKQHSDISLAQQAQAHQQRLAEEQHQAQLHTTANDMLNSQQDQQIKQQQAEHSMQLAEEAQAAQQAQQPRMG